MALGSSSARKSCSMASMMFFQPSRRMSPWRWAKWNTVFAAIWALGLLPKTVGRFSIDCRKEEGVAISQQEMFSFQHKLGQTVRNWLRERQQFCVRCLDDSSAHIHFAQNQGKDALPDTSWITEPPRHKLSKNDNNTEHFENACWKLTNTNLFCYGNSFQDESLLQKVNLLWKQQLLCFTIREGNYGQKHYWLAKLLLPLLNSKIQSKSDEPWHTVSANNCWITIPHNLFNTPTALQNTESVLSHLNQSSICCQNKKKT